MSGSKCCFIKENRLLIATDAKDLPLWIDRGELVSFINPFSYLKLLAEKDIATGIDRWGFDGKALQLIYQRFTAAQVERLSFDFTSLADSCFSYCERQQYKLAIVGSDSASLAGFLKVLRDRYPALNLAFSRDGFFSELERERLLQELNSIAPDVLICGMGAGLQERLLLDLRKTGWLGAGFTCGGFIHQTASAGGDYYPAWVNRFNLRFLYRMWDEPKLIRRYLLDYPQGMWRFYWDCRRGKLESDRHNG